MDPITVCITTWPNCQERLDYIDRTLTGLRANLSATGRDLAYIVTSEFSEGPLVERLREICKTHNATMLMRPRSKPNLGAHLNWMHRQIATPLRLYCQDDWLLHRPLEISADAGLLEVSILLACVRYWTAYTRFTARDDTWARIDNHGPYPVADNPALIHRRWFDILGWYKEGGDAGEHENNMLSRFAESQLLAVAPVQVADDGNYYFAHLGAKSAFEEKR